MSSETDKKSTSHRQESRSSSDDTKNRIGMVIGIILAIAVIVAGIYTIISNKKSEDGASGDETASVITQTDDPEAMTPTTKRPARTTVVQGADGSTTTKNIAPDGLGIDPDEEVDEGLARWDGKEPLPAGPREAVKPTLTAPTTTRKMPNPENPDLHNPRYGRPRDLVEYYGNVAFSMCVKNDTSYSKNLHNSSVRPLVTKRFAKEGYSFDKKGHSLSWKLSASDSGCNRLQSFTTVEKESPASGNTINYKLKIDQRVTQKTARGGSLKQNMEPIEGTAKMVFVNDMWLVDDFQLYGAELPVMY